MVYTLVTTGVDLSDDLPCVAQIRVFSLPRGKLLRVYNESLDVLEEMQALGTLGLDTIEFGRYAGSLVYCL